MVQATNNETPAAITAPGVADPLISVCIPTFNGERTIFETVESVLSQSVHEIELIVSDDNSSDKTLSIVKTFQDHRIRIVKGPASGVASDNWNYSVSLARGTYIKVMGQDDILYHDALSVELESLRRTSTLNPVMTVSKRDLITPRGRKLPEFLSRGSRLPSVLILEEVLPRIVRSGRNPLGEPVCVTFRRDAWIQTGGFTGSYLIDLATWIKLLKVGVGVSIDKKLCAFRVSRNSWSYALRRRQSAQTRTFFRSIAQDFPTQVHLTDLAIGSFNSRLAQSVRTIVLTFVAREKTR